SRFVDLSWARPFIRFEAGCFKRDEYSSCTSSPGLDCPQPRRRRPEPCGMGRLSYRLTYRIGQYWTSRTVGLAGITVRHLETANAHPRSLFFGVSKNGDCIGVRWHLNLRKAKIELILCSCTNVPRGPLEDLDQGQMF